MTDEKKALMLARRRFGDGYVLRQVAEECIELAHAALKIVRAKNGESPMLTEDAWSNCIEEIGDVRVMLAVLEEGLLPQSRAACADMYEQKLRRMVERLSHKEDEFDEYRTLEE